MNANDEKPTRGRAAQYDRQNLGGHATHTSIGVLAILLRAPDGYDRREAYAYGKSTWQKSACEKRQPVDAITAIDRRRRTYPRPCKIGSGEGCTEYAIQRIWNSSRHVHP